MKSWGHDQYERVVLAQHPFRVVVRVGDVDHGRAAAAAAARGPTTRGNAAAAAAEAAGDLRRDRREPRRQVERGREGHVASLARFDDSVRRHGRDRAAAAVARDDEGQAVLFQHGLGERDEVVDLDLRRLDGRAAERGLVERRAVLFEAPWPFASKASRIQPRLVHACASRRTPIVRVDSPSPCWKRTQAVAGPDGDQVSRWIFQPSFIVM